jgi:hypothetical protein
MNKKDVLLILAVLLLVGLVKVFQRQDAVREEEPDPGRSYYEHADSPHEFPQLPESYEGISRLVLDNPAGSLSFLPAEDGALTIQSTLIVFHPSEKAARDLEARIRIQVAQGAPGELKLEVNAPMEEAQGRFMINHTVWLPPQMVLEAKTRYGDIELTHLIGRVKLNHGAGKVLISDMTGDLDLDVSHSEVTLNEMRGIQTMNARNSRVTVVNSDGLSIIPKRSQLKLTDIRGPVTVTQGLLCGIVVEKAQRVSIEGSGDRISLSHVADGVTIRDEFEDIELNQVSGDVSVEGKRSQLTLTQSRGKRLSLRNSFRDTRLTESHFDQIDIELHQSNLEMELGNPGTGVVIDGHHSDVTLTMPHEQAFSADFVTKMGDIVLTQPDASFTQKKERGQSSLSRQTAQAPLIRISTSYGDITLNRTGGQ